MRSPPSSPSRSTVAAAGSPTSRAGAVASPATPSFFIIQEPSQRPVATHSTLPSPSTNDSKQSSTPATFSSSRQSLEPTHSLNPDSPGPHRNRQAHTTSGDTAAVLHEETDEDLYVAAADESRDDDSSTLHHMPPPRHMLSILNRVGSSPDLPLSNSWSSTVFSSSKKRQLLKPTNGTGASPQLAALQRSRLIPLPINIRTGTLTKHHPDSEFAANNNGTVSSSSLREVQPSTKHSEPEEERMNYEISIAALKQRVSYMERQLTKSNRHTQVLESQLAALTKEQLAKHNEKVQLVKKVDDLEKTNLQQRHAFDKLSQRYATVYENLATLSSAAAATASTSDGGRVDGKPSHVVSVQLVIQTLTKENQELQRKVRVLEVRHTDDKVIVRNQEKQIKRLRAEMEALQHMAGSKDDTFASGAFGSSSSTTTKPQLRDANSHRLTIHRADSTSSSSATTAQSTTLATITANGVGLQPPGLVVGDEYAYIDPNILKVLEKVDSQFSITSAISLSAVLKKWLHSCLHVVASTDLHAVLHVLLKRVCELLHCQHAAVFHVDHGGKKLLGLVSERGHVRWELPLDKGILGHAARQNVLCNVRKAYDDPRFFSSSDTITGTKSREVLCIPLTRELDHFQPEQASTLANGSVFAVLQCWNTTTQKPFSPHDQILGALLAIQAGIVLSQTKLTENLQKIHNRVLHLVHMNDELAKKATAQTPQRQDSSETTAIESASTDVSIVLLVRAAQRKFAEIVGITKLRIYILDADLPRIWHVGAQLEAGASNSTTVVQSGFIRKYANVASSLCGLLLPSSMDPKMEETNEECSSSATPTSCCRIVLDPTAEPTFNDTVDLKGGANGLYLVPIRSPWRERPLGMMQVARTGAALQSSTTSSFAGDSRPVAAAAKLERAHAQHVDDTLTMELIELFCQQFASLLHHALALQLHETCPREVHDAQLAYLTDRLDSLEGEYLREQEEAEAEAEMMTRPTTADAHMEYRLLQSVLQGERRDDLVDTSAIATNRSSSNTSRSSRPSSSLTARLRPEDSAAVVLEPVPLISTDSSYAIDVVGE